MRLVPKLSRRRVGALLLILLGVAFTITSMRLDWWEAAPLRRAEAFVFEEDFERANELKELFLADRSRWTGLQHEGGGSVQLEMEHVHAGRQSLRCTADKHSGKTPKADIELGTLHFIKGDDVWFTGWYYLVGGTDATGVFLWDLETSRKWQSPGRRVYIQSGECLASDLGKWWGGTTFRQALAARVAFPKDRWTRLKVHLYLSDRADGVMEVWQDAERVLDARGQTLPTAKTVYDRLQIGITANGNRGESHVVYVDDVRVSNRPLD